MRRHPLSPGPTPTDPQPLPAGTDIAGAFLAAVAERHGGITLTRDDVLRFSRRLVVIEPAVIDQHALTLRVVEDTPAAVARHWATRAMDAAQALYRRHGFTELAAPLGGTGHFSCDRYYLRAL